MTTPGGTEETGFEPEPEALNLTGQDDLSPTPVGATRQFLARWGITHSDQTHGVIVGEAPGQFVIVTCCDDVSSTVRVLWEALEHMGEDAGPLLPISDRVIVAREDLRALLEVTSGGDPNLRETWERLEALAGGTESAENGTPDYPKPDFPHHAYGVDLTWLGEDGGMAARGHIPDLRFAAACNHLARGFGGANIYDDRSLSLEEVLGDVIRVWAVPADPALYGEDGWAVTWHDVTEQTPGAFPLTVLWP